MARPQFNRFNAAAHIVEGLEDWAEQNRIELYPGVVTAGAERYPLITVSTDSVTNNADTKDLGTDTLDYQLTVVVAVKEKLTKSGPEWAAELADKIVDLMDGTEGEHDGYIVTACKWAGGTPGYDDERDVHYIEMGWTLTAEAPAPVTTTTNNNNN